MRASGPGALKTGSEMTRRGFLQVGGIGLGSLGLRQPGWHDSAGLAAKSERSAILLMLVGGPSQFETWDPKPDLPPRT